MDIEEFYAENERRRRSDEIELGREWHDVHGARYELSWVADTGELYMMREPTVKATEDAFGDIFGISVPVDEISVAVVGWIPTRERLEEVLQGWPQAMEEPDGISWVAARLRKHQVPRAAPEQASP